MAEHSCRCRVHSAEPEKDKRKKVLMCSLKKSSLQTLYIHQTKKVIKTFVFSMNENLIAIPFILHHRRRRLVSYIKYLNNTVAFDEVANFHTRKSQTKLIQYSDWTKIIVRESEGSVDSQQKFIYFMKKTNFTRSSFTRSIPRQYKRAELLLKHLQN
jgi:hypothetical protein